MAVFRRKCSRCGQELIYKNKKSYARAIRKNSMCKSCAWQNPEYREKISQKSKELWQNLKRRKKQSEKFKKLWQDPEYREKQLQKQKEIWQDEEYREKMSQKFKELWQNPEYREKMSRISKELWQDEEYKKSQIEKLTKEFRENQSQKHKELWQNPEYRENQIKKHNTKEFRESQLQKSKEIWERPGYRENQIRKQKEVWQNPEYREKMSRISKELWQDSKYRENQVKKQKEVWENEEYREKQSKINKDRCQDPKYREKRSRMSKELWENPEFRENQSQKHIELWQNPEYREKHKKLWESLQHREKMAKIRADQSGKISSIQKMLYSILDDLNIIYYKEYEDKECTIGPYNFDCVIPREGKTTLLIECQGDYWHSIEKNINNDKSKLSYINNNFSDQYEIKYFWEHEFLNHNKVVELIKYWMGITKIKVVDYSFKDLIIKKSLAKEYRLLLEKYHYLPNAGRGGVAYGCYLEDELISVVVFSPSVRQNIKLDGVNKFMELSRFCIHPKYQKKNLGSYFISRAIKVLKEDKPNIEAIVSYCDTTFNHDGALYKSLNFIQDRAVRPDYWYVNEKRWVMHKKTLYNHAVKMKMKEKEFAEKHGYIKVYGKEKLRFVLKFEEKGKNGKI